MDRQEARDILLLYRAGADAENAHPRMREALAEVERDPELAQWFKAHCTLDETVRSGFLQIAVPASLRERILTCPKITGLVAWWQQQPSSSSAAAAGPKTGNRSRRRRPVPGPNIQDCRPSAPQPSLARLMIARFRIRALASLPSAAVVAGCLGIFLAGQGGATARADFALFTGSQPPPAAEQLAESPARMLRVESPDKAQTFTDNTTLRHLLSWDGRTQTLRVFMVFTNSNTQGSGVSRVEEQFGFRLPGISLDPATGVFSVRGPRGNTVPVAKRVRGGGGLRTQNGVEPTVGTRIFVSIVEGQVKVTLTADPASSATTDRSPTHWVIDGPVGAL